MSPVKKSSQIHYPFEQLKQERVNWINKYSPRTKSCCGCLLLLIIFGCVSVLLIWEYMWKTHTTYDIYRCSGAPTPLPTLNPNSFNGTLLAESFGTVYSWTPYQYSVNLEQYDFSGPIVYTSSGFYVPKPNNTNTQRVYQCSSVQQIQAVLSCLPELMKVSVRGGAQSLNGASMFGQYVIALEQFAHTATIQTNGFIDIQPTTRAGEFIKMMYDVNPQLNYIASDNPLDSMAGFALGGGHGLMSSWYGLAAHYLQSVNVVLPNGTAQVVTDASNPGFMAALRGAGQNLAIVTQLTFDFTSIPQHNWNLVLFSNILADIDQIQAALEQWFTIISTGQNSWASSLEINAIQNLVYMRLWTIAPSSGLYAIDVPTLKSLVATNFANTGFILNHTMSDVSWYTLYTEDIPFVGSVGTAWSIQGSNSTNQSKIYAAIEEWDALLVQNVDKDINHLLNTLVGAMPAKMRLNNFNFGFQTGPFQNNSYILPYSIRSVQNVQSLVTVSDKNVNNINQISGLYEVVSSLRYPNYTPTWFDYTTLTFFFPSTTENITSLRQQIDPQTIMVNPLQLK